MGYLLIESISGMERRFPLQDGTHLIGRSNSASVKLNSATVSRRHAEIIVNGELVKVRDLCAENGTFVNGERVSALQLQEGDEIRFGRAVLSLRKAGKVDFPENCTDQQTILQFESRSDWQLPMSSSVSALQRAYTGQSTLLAALVELGGFLVQNHDEDEVYAACLDPVTKLFRYRLACLLMLNEVGEPEVRCHHPHDSRVSELVVSRQMVNDVLRSRQSLLVRDAGIEPWQSARAKGICSAMVVPLCAGDDVMGVLYIDQDQHDRAFSQRHLHRLELVSNLIASKITNTRVRNDIRCAAMVQKTMLRANPPCPPEYEAHACVLPCDPVGGDFYEALELEDGRYLYAAGDVVGHGMPAALGMANALATLRALAPSCRTPLELVTRLRDVLGEMLDLSRYLSLFVGFLDPRCHRLNYVNAGHEPPAICAPSQAMRRLPSTGPPIGMDLPVATEMSSIEFPPGTLFSSWSDGFPEAFKAGTNPEYFGVEGLLQQVHCGSSDDLQQIAESVFQNHDRFLSGPAQDDRTLLLLRRVGESAAWRARPS